MLNKMGKFFVFCFTLLAINWNTAASTYCGLCNVPAQQNKDDIGYQASGSAISSQFLLPDGSLVTNSKETSISSGGIKTTFHELKKEADRFIQTGSSNHQGFGSAIPRIPIPIPVVHEIPYSPITKIPFPYITSPYLSGASQGINQHQSSISQAQLQSASNGVVQHQYQTIPKITSYTKEEEIKKKVVTTSKGSSEYPSAIDGSQYQIAQQNSIDTSSNSNNIGVPLRFPSENTNVNYQVGSSYNQVAGSVVPAPVVPRQQSSYQSSYDHSASSSSSSQSNNQQQPSSFYAGVVDLNLNGNTGYNNQAGDVNTYISHGVPIVKVNTNNEHTEQHYGSTGGGVPAVYNSVGGVSHNKFQQGDYHSKSQDYEGGYGKPLVSTIQYGTETNSTHVHNVGNAGVPAVHVSKVVVRVPQTVESSQTYQKQGSASSQVTGYGGQFSSGGGSGVVYTQPGVQVPVGNSAAESSKVHADKQIYSSSQTYGFPSPAIIQGVPLDQQEEGSYSSNGGSSYYNNGYVEGGAVDGVSVPILVHGVPQPPQPYNSNSESGYFSSSSSSSSSSGGSVPVNSGYYYSNSDNSENNKIQAGSAINPNAEHLCGGCFSSGSLSSSGVPVKNSYGISTSFSSHSSTVNGKKSESREAAVAVNDNGKVDSYHIKS